LHKVLSAIRQCYSLIEASEKGLCLKEKETFFQFLRNIYSYQFIRGKLSWLVPLERYSNVAITSSL